jgi:pyruvate dehydrogenase E1 component alpha subunit
MADPAKYRSAAEHEVWKSRDPIPAFAKNLLEEGIATQAQLDAILVTARATVQEAVQFAEQSPWPLESAIYEDIYV